MCEEARPGAWHVSWGGDEPVTVRDQSNNVIASIGNGTSELMLARGTLIAATPELYESVDVALKVFAAIAQYGDENSALAAQDMIPPLQSALDGANFLGAITPEVLSAS